MLPLLALALVAEPRTLKHDVHFTKIDVSIRGNCGAHAVSIGYSNDWSVSGRGRFVTVIIDGRRAPSVIGTLNGALQGRHVEQVSLLPCSGSNPLSFGVAVFADKEESRRRSMKDYIGVSVTRSTAKVDE